MDETVKRRALLKPETAPERAAPWVASARRAFGVDALVPLLVGLVALALNLTRLGAPSLWMDEAFSVQLARQPLPVLMAAYSSGAEPNMIAYHLLLHGWLALAVALRLPATEVFVRLPSAVFAAVAAVALYALGWRFLGRMAALVAAAVYVASGWQLTYAQEARGYAMQLTLVVIGWLALLAGASSHATGWRSWRWWGLFTAAMALSVYTQAFSILILLAQGLAMGVWLVWPSAWRVRAWRSLPQALVSFVGIGALITPFVLASRHGSKTGWLPSPSLGELTAKLESLVGTGRHAALILGALAALALVVAAGVWLLATPGGKLLRERAPARLGRMDGGALLPKVWPVIVGLSLWVIVPVVVSYVVSLGPTRIFSSRYLVVILPSLCLSLGAGVAALRWPGARLVSAGLLAVIMLTLTPSYYAHAQVEDWRTPVRWLERAYQPGDGLVSYNNVQGCEIPVDYYLQTDGSSARFDANSPGVINWSLYGHGDPFGRFAEAVDLRALAAYAAQHPRLFFIAGRFTDVRHAAKAHEVQDWLAAHYHFVGEISSGVVTISLYDTRV